MEKGKKHSTAVGLFLLAAVLLVPVQSSGDADCLNSYSPGLDWRDAAAVRAPLRDVDDERP